jgi:PEGA domain-containing protein
MRRVLVFVAVAAVVLAVGMFLFSGPSSKPAPPETASTPPPAATPAPATPPPTPSPDAKAPVQPARPSSPRPRAAGPSTAATPEVAAAPASDAAMLQIDVDVPDAQVFVDRVFLGKAPLTTSDVKPGSHRLNVSAAGYEGVAQSIDVKPGMQQVSIKLREVRLDAAIDVIHKHRMGSCKGRLTATPQGLRYEATEKDDAFRAGLLDLDGFEVDYLKKNLRVKLKSGKSYDFTDPEGNADHLFVFHRDVDKARERLRKGDPPAQQ